MTGLISGGLILYNLCHPTFAMTGALAWQVNHTLNKNFILWFEGRSHGDLPGISPRVCVMCCVFLLSLYTISTAISVILHVQTQRIRGHRHGQRIILQSYYYH